MPLSQRGEDVRSVLVSLFALALTIVACSRHDTATIAPAVAPEAGAVVDTDPCATKRARIEAAVRDAPRRSPDALVAVHGAACPPVFVATGSSRLEVTRPFRMASVAKTFVATLALAEVARGKLTLDSPLEAVVPGVPAVRGTTVRALASHTAGLFPYEKDTTFLAWQKAPPSARSPEELLTRSLAHTPRARTNAGFLYANTSYVALGRALEGVTKEPLATTISREVLDRYELRETHPERGDEPLVPSFDARGNDTTRAHHASWLYAAGDLVTTLADLVRWTRLYGTGAVIPEKLRSEWLHTVPTDDDGVGYGLGVFVTRGEASGGFGEARSHAGDVAGLHLEAVYFVALDAAIVAVTNRDGADPDALVLAAARAIGP